MVAHEWYPVPGSAKARLARLALREFGARGYDGVGVTELAARAGVTTGSLYHHFGSKAGLYGLVRTEVERRVLDRMEGAAAAVAEQGGAAPLRACLLVGFNAAVAQGAARMLAERHPQRAEDPIAGLLADLAPGGDAVLARVLAAAWRAALAEVAAGAPPDLVRPVLATLL
jgi:AcrR family transcriptional regulator